MQMNAGLILQGKDPQAITSHGLQNSANAFALDNARQMAPHQNALAQAQARGAQMQVQAGENQMVAQLLERVEAHPDKPKAYRAALQIAQSNGIDVSRIPQEYDPDAVALMRGLAQMGDDERTEFERTLTGLSPEQQEQAIMVRLGLAPDANAQLRGRTGDEPLTTAGKLRADLERGNITPEDFARETEPGSGIRIGKNGVLEVVQAPVGRAARNSEEKSLASEINLASQLANVGKLAGMGPDGRMKDPSMLTYRGQAEDFLTRQAEKLGVTPDEAARMATYKRTQFITAVEQLFNAYRKEITGAAAAVQELDRLKKSFINMDMSPTQFEAAYAQYSNELKRSMRIRRKLLREGFDLSTEEGGDAMDRLFLGGGDDNPADRYIELVQEVGEDEAYRILALEGYE